jgi:NifU-like protein involved in Fe-S cluster formation
MQDAMTELITNKNYSEAERILHVVDKLMLDLIEDMGGRVIKSGLWA